jgi:DNA-binding response OmpR family regulator
MLTLLYERAGEPVSREELSAVLSSSEGNMCDVYICKLRTKLESVSNRKLIYTVRSKGYALKL